MPGIKVLMVIGKTPGSCADRIMMVLLDSKTFRYTFPLIVVFAIDCRIMYEDGTIYKSYCGNFCPVVSGFGVFVKSLLASFHGICRSQPFTVRIYKMVFDGRYSG